MDSDTAADGNQLATPTPGLCPPASLDGGLRSAGALASAGTDPWTLGDGAAPYAAGPLGGLLTIADAQGDLHLWDTATGRTSPLSEMAVRGPIA